MSTLIKIALATLLVSLAIALPAKEASAARTTGFANCIVFNVEFDAPSSDGVLVSSPRLIFQCANGGDPNNYSAYYAPSSSGCSTVPLTQVQVWTNVLSAAYISGMQATIWWSQDTASTCPDRSVTSISLQPPA
jgi:hypothetical protein